MSIYIISKANLTLFSVVIVFGFINIFCCPGNDYSQYKFGKLLVESAETIQHEYGNDNIKSNTHYYRKVIFRDREGNFHESPVSKFETAFLIQNERKADWIGSGPVSELLPRQGFYKDTREQFSGKDSFVLEGNSLCLMIDIQLDNEIKSAKVYITGLGFYEFYINGERVGDHVLTTAKTPYHKTILYDTYDVTDLMKQGANAFGIHLGNGWYNPYVKWWNDYRMPVIKVNEIFIPMEVKVQNEGMKVYDMGQNFSGWVRIKAKGEQNTILKIRFAEDVNSDGTIDVTSNEYAKAIAEYNMKDNEIETYETHFSYFGFKYVEIKDQDEPLNILNILVHTGYSVNTQTGTFECDNPLTNKIHKATAWSQKSNMPGYPGDHTLCEDVKTLILNT